MVVMEDLANHLIEHHGFTKLGVQWMKDVLHERHEELHQEHRSTPLDHKHEPVVMSYDTEHIIEHMVEEHGWSRSSAYMNVSRHAGEHALRAEHQRLHEDETAKHLDHTHEPVVKKVDLRVRPPFEPKVTMTVRGDGMLHLESGYLNITLAPYEGFTWSLPGVKVKIALIPDPAQGASVDMVVVDDVAQSPEEVAEDYEGYTLEESIGDPRTAALKNHLRTEHKWAKRGAWRFMPPDLLEDYHQREHSPESHARLTHAHVDGVMVPKQ